MGITKHELIIKYIEGLEVGTKVSVRQIAKEMEVSDGTAYRAIKEAETKGLVSSIPKVGTVRIEKVEEKEIEDLTLAEVTRIVEGTVLCGRKNLDHIFKNFIIGASTEEVVRSYVEPGGLVIVGNRDEIHKVALEHGAHLLVVAGFSVSPDLIKVAHDRELTIISSPYDSFTVASMINRALYERLAEREITLVEDVMVREPKYLFENDKVADWYRLAQQYKHSRFPIVNQDKEVLGLVTPIEVFGISKREPLSKVMSPIISITKDAGIGHAARMMIWEGVELLPVVDNNRLVGVLSRQDIITAFQHVQKQPHMGETVDNLILSGFRAEDLEDGVRISGEITDFMANEFGSASVGTLSTLINSSAYIAVRKRKRMDFATENLSFYEMKPVEIGKVVEVEAKILSMVRRSIKLEVTVCADDEVVAKALVAGRHIER